MSLNTVWKALKVSEWVNNPGVCLPFWERGREQVAQCRNIRWYFRLPWPIPFHSLLDLSSILFKTLPLALRHWNPSYSLVHAIIQTNHRLTAFVIRLNISGYENSSNMRKRVTCLSFTFSETNFVVVRSDWLLFYYYFSIVDNLNFYVSIFFFYYIQYLAIKLRPLTIWSIFQAKLIIFVSFRCFHCSSYTWWPIWSDTRNYFLNYSLI